MRNEKGSVLTVAVILVVLLSFSITTITAYTQNVATRTNTTISVRDDEIIADTYLKQAMRDFRDTIENADYDTFQELDDLTDLIPDTIDRILADYSVVVVETSSGDYVREYRFSYYIESLDTTVFKDLVISVEMASVEGQDYRTIFHPDDGIINRFLESFDPDAGDSTYCHEDYDGGTDLEVCQDELLKAIGSGTSGRGQSLSGSLYLGGEYEGGSSQKQDIELNGNVLIIDGDFIFDNFESIEGAHPDEEGSTGIVIVNGSFEANSKFGKTLNNVLILVRDEIVINIDSGGGSGNDFFNGENFVILGYSSADIYVKSSTEGEDYYTKKLTNLPGENLEFIGSDPYTDIDLILDYYLKDLEETASYVYEFFY